MLKPTLMPEPSYTEPGMKNATLNYILYLCGFVIPFLLPIIGLIFAYMSRGKGGADADSHYTYQIRTFWIAVPGSIIASLLVIVGIGFLLLFALTIWMIIRCVKGIRASSNNRPIEDPTTWWI